MGYPKSIIFMQNAVRQSEANKGRHVKPRSKYRIKSDILPGMQVLFDHPVLQSCHRDGDCSEEEGEEDVLSKIMDLIGLVHHDLEAFSIFLHNLADELFSNSGLVLQRFHQVVGVGWTSVVASLISNANLETNFGFTAQIQKAEVVSTIALRGE
jgi:hypothetical protein